MGLTDIIFDSLSKLVIRLFDTEPELIDRISKETDGLFFK